MSLHGEDNGIAAGEVAPANDIAALPEPSRFPFPPAWLAVGPAEPTRFRGCRIHHEVSLGTTAFLIHAGSNFRIGRDDAIHFLLTGDELDELIEHLVEVRHELSAKEVTRG